MKSVLFIILDIAVSDSIVNETLRLLFYTLGIIVFSVSIYSSVKEWNKSRINYNEWVSRGMKKDERQQYGIK